MANVLLRVRITASFDKILEDSRRFRQCQRVPTCPVQISFRKYRGRGDGFRFAFAYGVHISWLKYRTSNGMSSGRSRKGGTRIGKTFRTVVKVATKLPLFYHSVEGHGWLQPLGGHRLSSSVCFQASRSNSPSCKTRRSLGWSSKGMSPTSSRNSVPLIRQSSRAANLLPLRRARECTPRSVPPNNSLSSRYR